MRRGCFRLLTLLLLLPGAPSSAAAQGAPAPGRLAPLAWLAGEWQGSARGQPGEGTVSRSYERVLGGRFLAVRNISRYKPTAESPRGEVHEDRGFIGYDRARHRPVCRQFHGEGFVNTYVADSVAMGDSIVRFTSEQIENIPAGWRARETYTRTGPDRFTERFELAEPGKAFELYSETALRRRWR